MRLVGALSPDNMGRAWVIVDSAAMAVVTFLLAVIIVQRAGLGEYGSFTLSLQIGLFAISLANAIFITPVYTNRISQPIFLTCITLTILPIVVSLSIYLASSGSQDRLSVCAFFCFVTSQIFRETSRQVAIRFRLWRGLIGQGALFSATSMCLVIALLFTSSTDHELSALALLLISTAGLLSTVPVLVSYYSAASKKPFEFALLRDNYLKCIDVARWAIPGVLVTELQSRGFVYIVAASISTDFLGLLFLPRLLFSPALQLVSSVSRLDRARLTECVTAGAVDRAQRILWRAQLRGLALCLATTVVAGVLLLNCSRLQFSFCLKVDYLMLLFWAVIIPLQIVNMYYSLILQSLGCFRELFHASLTSSFLAISLCTLLVLTVPRLVLVSTLVAECVLCLNMRRRLRQSGYLAEPR